jgi:hypothetical protein
MKKQNKKNRSRAVTKSRRLRGITIGVAVLVIAVAGITVLSKQLSNAKPSPIQVGNSQTPKYVTVKVAGRNVQVNPQAGQVSMTPQKAQEMAELLKARLNKSTEGLVQVQNRDGSISMDLQGRAQNVVLARTNADGTVEQACVDNPLAGAEFLGIDPQLVGAEPSPRANGQMPLRTPARKANQ